MKKTIQSVSLLTLLLLLVLALLAACGGGSASNTTTPSNATVTMGATTFSVSSITISKGSTITFMTDQGGTAHHLVNGSNGQPRVEGGTPDFGSAGQTIGPGSSWTTAPWNVAGTFHVTCTYHPTTMTLTVTVTG
jgi:plastocyanin